VLDRGWAIVATDYVGLGASPPHPYLVGRPEARSVLDAVRAARTLRPAHLAPKTVVWGHSQGGGAALWTGIVAPSYAPALTGRGRVWRKKGDDDKAMADFDKAIALDERSIESRLARADIQLARRNQDAALVDLKRVVDLKPRDLFEVLAQTAAKAKIKELERDTCRDGSGQRDARCL